MRRIPVYGEDVQNLVAKAHRDGRACIAAIHDSGDTVVDASGELLELGVLLLQTIAHVAAKLPLHARIALLRDLQDACKSMADGTTAP
jgi:hypothetical protein